MSIVKILIVKTVNDVADAQVVVDVVKNKIADVLDITVAAKYCPEKQDLDATMP